MRSGATDETGREEIGANPPGPEGVANLRPPSTPCDLPVALLRAASPDALVRLAYWTQNCFQLKARRSSPTGRLTVSASFKICNGSPTGST